MAAELSVRLELGTVRHGVWCDACALPSVVEVDGLWLRETGVTVLFTARQCADCGRRN